MATYPVKILKDENGRPFVPLTSLDAVSGEKHLQYILDAEQISPGHFRVKYRDLETKDLINSIIVVRWPKITSTVKPSYLQLNEEAEIILYNGTGTEYLDLEESSGTVNMLACDGTKWILTSGAGSGSGHVITDENGTTMEQQKVLSFVGFNVENDNANRATKIINPDPINNLTTSESGVGALDAYQGHVLAARSIPTGGTAGQVLAKKNGSDYQVEWVNTAGDNVIDGDGSITKIIGLTYEEYKELESRGEIDSTIQYHITDVSSSDISFITKNEIQEMIDDSVPTSEEIQSIVTSNVVNNLTTNSTTQSLSAAQGKILNDKIETGSRLIAEAVATDYTSELILSGLNLEPGTYELVIAEWSDAGTSTGHVLRLNGATSGYQGIHMHPVNRSESTTESWRVAYHYNGLCYLNGWSVGVQLNYGIYTLHYFNQDWITVTGETHLVQSPSTMTSGKNTNGKWNMIYQQGSYNGHTTRNITSLSITSLDSTKIGPDSYIRLYKK